MTRFSVGVLTLTVATWVALLARIASDPTNHVGAEPLLAVVPFVILLPLAWLGSTPKKQGIRLILTVYALLSIAAIVSLDRANVLVQYDRWAKRGMPERPCAGIVWYITACQRPVVPPARHAGVPPEAVWTGGVDGGAWVACKGPFSTEYDCKVFHDHTGEVVASGRFTFVGPGSPPDARLLEFNGFDGDAIHLNSGRSLTSRRLPAATITPPAQ